MTTQTTTIEETKTGTIEGQRVRSRAAKDQMAYWKSRVRHRTYSKGEEITHVRHLQARIKLGGREGWFNLGTDNENEAAKKAALIYGCIKHNGWEVANARYKPKPEKYSSSPTLREFFQAVEQYGDLNRKTFVAYCRKFRSIVADIFGIRAAKGEKFGAENSRRWRERVDNTKLGLVTPERVSLWRKSYLARRGDNQLAQKRARHSADSAIRSAKALFGKKIRPKLKDFPFPTPLPFDGITVAQVHNPYESHIDPLVLCAAANRELRFQHPEAYKIFLLSLHAGLRRNETDKLRWESINWTKKRIAVETTTDFSAKNKASEASVPMNDVLREALLSFRPASNSGYVIESKVEPRPKVTYNHYRATQHFVTLIRWLKKHNVRTNCPIHTLRKELGSIVCENMNIVAAQRMLRHKDVTTTARYYTAVKRDIGDMLTNFMKGETPAGPLPAASGSKPGSLVEQAPKDSLSRIAVGTCQSGAAA